MFQFIFQGETYDSCTSIGHYTSWCATDVDIETRVELNWGNCDCRASACGCDDDHIDDGGGDFSVHVPVIIEYISADDKSSDSSFRLTCSVSDWSCFYMYAQWTTPLIEFASDAISPRGSAGMLLEIFRYFVYALDIIN